MIGVVDSPAAIFAHTNPKVSFVPDLINFDPHNVIVVPSVCITALDSALCRAEKQRDNTSVGISREVRCLGGNGGLCSRLDITTAIVCVGCTHSKGVLLCD